MHSTGRPSSVHQTGLLGFANEYYREMPPTSSTLQTLIAQVLSSGGTGSRTTAIRNYIDGDYVRQAYADEEMDEDPVGCYRLCYAYNSLMSSDRRIFGGVTTDSPSGTAPITNTNEIKLVPVYASASSGQTTVRYERYGGVSRGSWVYLGPNLFVDSDQISGGTFIEPKHVGVWHRYA